MKAIDRYKQVLIPLAFMLLCIHGVPTAASSKLGDQELAIINDYCSECHNYEDFAGGFAFDLLDHENMLADAALWEKVRRKVMAGMMPPPGKQRPEEDEIMSFVTGVASAIDRAWESSPDPGSRALQRLNRREYENAIRDLLGISIDASQYLPADDSSGGFDNIANVLSISPALMESYITAASKISALAVGDNTLTPSRSTYRPTSTLQDAHIQGLPLGTRGGLAVQHLFALDGIYEFEISVSGANSAFSLDPIGVEDPVEIVLDNERVKLLEPESSMTFRIPVTAGQHEVQAAFLDTQLDYGVDDLHSVKANSISLRSMEIRGPFEASGAGATESRRRIFTCSPGDMGQEACARHIIQRLATRAFRRPVEGESLETLMKFYTEGLKNQGFEKGIQYALGRILVDPQFIFRFESEPGDLAPGEIYRLNDYELASRLSFFIWSSIPDDELLELAKEGRLREQKVLHDQVERMLLDSKASALVENFGTQWLSLPRLATTNPTSSDFDGNLRQAMEDETRLLLEHIFVEDRSVIELLNAEYTFVNERLAKHYGIPNIRGSHYRKVSLADTPRRGILGHGSILTITSAPNRTSPVIRGTWILEHILGTPPPPPPPGVETNLEQTTSDPDAQLTIRERLEKHRENPSCAGCHDMIDPIGFALEKFDAVGKWRLSDNGSRVDTNATLWDGSNINGVNGLLEALLDKRDLFVEALTEKLMTYGLGRKVEYFDMPEIREIVRQAKRDNYRFSSLVLGIVSSRAFQYKSKASEPENDIVMHLDAEAIQ